jgi:hypothetical protein
MLFLALLFTSCEGERLCLGLNNGTGSANTPKGARKKNRGGYKSPREVEARDRQKKRIRKRQRQSARKSHGGGNTTGKGRKNFSININLDFNPGGNGRVPQAKH